MALDPALQTEFLDLLERDADFRDEVRRHLLTAELIELPERFAAFAARVDSRFDGIDRQLQSILDDLRILKGYMRPAAPRATTM